jgi:serine/threonine protein kinase
MSDPSGFDTSHYYALPIGTNLLEFRIEQVLGHGGFGITYLATDTNLDERVAIKEYLPNEIAVRVSDSTVRARPKPLATIWSKASIHFSKRRELSLGSGIAILFTFGDFSN